MWFKTQRRSLFQEILRAMEFRNESSQVTGTCMCNLRLVLSVVFGTLLQLQHPFIDLTLYHLSVLSDVTVAECLIWDVSTGFMHWTSPYSSWMGPWNKNKRNWSGNWHTCTCFLLVSIALLLRSLIFGGESWITE